MLRRLLLGSGPRAHRRRARGGCVGGGAALALFGAGGGAALAYLAAALTGVLTGLVAGKPIWASGAKIEAGLKAFFGALLAAGLMFAIRQWVHFVPDMAFLARGDPADLATTASDVPALALPLVAVLGGFFELDNTGEPKG